MNGSPHKDSETKKTYHYKNLIIEKVRSRVYDSYGRMDLHTTGSGDAYFITNGYAIPIKWNKTSRKAKTRYTYNDQEIKVNDGNTMIEIIPTSSSINITSTPKGE